MSCEGLEEMASLFKAFSNPIRLKILALCAEREVSTRELREKLGVSKPLLLAHIRKLLKAGLLESRLVIDEEKGRLVRLYRTANFEICVSRGFFRQLHLKSTCSSGEDV